MKNIIALIALTLGLGIPAFGQTPTVHTVDILFIYLNTVTPQEHGCSTLEELQSSMEIKAQAAIQYANTTFENSRIDNVKYRVAGVQRLEPSISITDPGPNILTEILNEVRKENVEDFIQEIAATTGADFIYIISHYMPHSSFSGVASITEASIRPTAVGNGMDYNTFTHEMGHLLRCNHPRDPGNTYKNPPLGTFGPEQFNFGYHTPVIKGEDYGYPILNYPHFENEAGGYISRSDPNADGTIMSYATSDANAVFSNPDITVSATWWKWQPGDEYMSVFATRTIALGMPEGIPDNPNAAYEYEIIDENGISWNARTGAADNARVIREFTGSIAANLHSQATQPAFTKNLTAIRHSSYFYVTVSATGENLKFQLYQDGVTTGTAIRGDYEYKIIRAYPWEPDETGGTGIPGQQNATWEITGTSATAFRVVAWNHIGSATSAPCDITALPFYTVTFNGNGAILIPPTTLILTQTYTKEGHTGEIDPSFGLLPAPYPREGYTFKGWWTAPTGGTQIQDFTPVTGNMTLYTHWEPNGNGGGGGNSSGGGGGGGGGGGAPSPLLLLGLASLLALKAQKKQ